MRAPSRLKRYRPPRMRLSACRGVTIGMPCTALSSSSPDLSPVTSRSASPPVAVARITSLTLGGQTCRRKVDPVNRGSVVGERELSAERGPIALTSKEVDGRGRQDARQGPWSAVFDPAPVNQCRLGVDLDSPLDGQTATLRPLEPQHERDLLPATLSAHRGDPKGRRLPVTLREALHQGTIRSAGYEKCAAKRDPVDSPRPPAAVGHGALSGGENREPLTIG